MQKLQTMFGRRNGSDQVLVSCTVNESDWNCQPQSFVLYSQFPTPRLANTPIPNYSYDDSSRVSGFKWTADSYSNYIAGLQTSRYTYEKTLTYHIDDVALDTSFHKVYIDISDKPESSCTVQIKADPLIINGIQYTDQYNYQSVVLYNEDWSYKCISLLQQDIRIPVNTPFDFTATITVIGGMM